MLLAGIFKKVITISNPNRILSTLEGENVHLLLNKDLGYQPENLYFTYLKKHDGPREAIRLKEELLRLPFVKGVTLTDDVPYNGLYGVYVKGSVQNEEECQQKCRHHKLGAEQKRFPVSRASLYLKPGLHHG